MADSNTISKLYDVRELGSDLVLKNLNAINEAFKDIKLNKQALNNLRGTIEDPAELARINKELNDLRLQEARLKTERQELINQAKTQQLIRQQELATLKAQESQIKNQTQAERQLALAKASEAKAAADLARADLIRLQAIIAQDKELDRLIALEEKKAKADAKSKAAADALAGSYNGLKAEIKQLYDILKSTPTGTDLALPDGTLISYDEAVEKLKLLTAEEQNFRRQFAKDGLLVGEYTTGILQAFQKFGLGDLIKAQSDKATGALQGLDAEFEKLKQELRDAQALGITSLDTIERALIDNRNEAAGLEQQIESMNAALEESGDVGTQVTDSIKKGFSGLKGQIGQLILGFIGFQAILGGVRQSFDEAIQIDSLDAALTNISKTEEELAINQQFLAETTDRLGLAYLDTEKAFKNFYASSTLAGISAQETRDIFLAAATASSTLRLSQEDTNGVLLAFGQIASKGKVQAEELRGQIGERLPGAFSIAAKAIGKTEQELNKMLENGEVLSNEFLPKFAAELNKTFGGDSTAKVESLQASISRFRNEVTRLVAENKDSISSLISLFLKAGSVLLGFVGLITGNFPLIITLVGLYATGWAVLNKELVISQARLLLVNIQLIAGRVALGAVNIVLAASAVFQAAYNGVLALYTGIANVATTSTLLFGTALRLLPFGIILTVLAVVIASFKAFGHAVNGSTEELRKQAIQFNANAEVMKVVNEATGIAISKIQELTKIVINNKISLEDRKKALQDLIAINPQYLEGLNLENIATQQGVDILRNYVLAIRDKAEAEALSANRAKALTAQLELQQKAERARTDNDFAREEYGKVKTTFSGFSAPKYTDYVSEYYEKLAEEQQVAIDFYDKKATDRLIASADKLRKSEQRVVAETVAAKRAGLEKQIKDSENSFGLLLAADKKGQDANIAQRKKYQEQLDDLNGKEEKEKKTRTPRDRASRLSVDQQDKFKDIEAEQKALQTALEERYAEGLTGERQYTLALQKINDDAANKKIAKLSDSNAAERQKRAELRLSIVQDAKKTYEVLYKLDLEALDAQKNLEEREAKSDLNKVDASLNSTELQKAEAKQIYYDRLLSIQQEYQIEADGLEKFYNQLSIKNVQSRGDAVEDAEQKSAAQRIENKRKEDEELNKSIDRTQSSLTNAEVTDYENKKAELFNKQFFTAGLRNTKLQELEREHQQRLLDIEKGSLISRKELNDTFYEGDIINAEQYKERKEKIEREIAENAAKSAEQTVQAQEASFKKVATVISQIADGLRQVYSSVISPLLELQKQEIQQQLDTTKKQLDADKERRLAYASSKAEEAAIIKEFAAKRTAVEKKAAQEQREIALKELAIQSAIAAIRAFATAPNYIVGAIQAALIGAEYFIQKKKIERQQFKYGGSVPTATGGDIHGPSHAHGGVPFEAEGGELAIINKNSAGSNKVLNVTGTARQIASAINVHGGGIDFAGGAITKRFAQGGYLGSNVRPPIFNSYFSGSRGNDTNTDFSEIKEMIAATQLTILAESRKQVVLNPNAVTKEQQSQARSVSLATI